MLGMYIYHYRLIFTMSFLSKIVRKVQGSRRSFELADIMSRHRMTFRDSGFNPRAANEKNTCILYIHVDAPSGKQGRFGKGRKSREDKIS